MGHVMRNTFVWTCWLLAVPFEAVTVGPSLCPTNKIAPHKRITSWDRPSYRTFAAYYDLLSPNAPPPQSNPSNPQNPQNQQHEQPQEDQPDDCGDIDDYDENDLSSIIQQTRRQDRADNRFWFGGLFNKPPQPPQPLPPYQPPNGATKPTVRPPRPSYPAARPPYWSGGVFSNNPYRPPQNEVPSDNFKPVHESAHYSDVPQTYRPGAIVGGPVGHIVGLTQARPTTSPILDESTRRRPEYLENFRPHSTQASQYSTQRPRPRKFTNNNSVIGSFIDLLFK